MFSDYGAVNFLAFNQVLFTSLQVVLRVPGVAVHPMVRHSARTLFPV